MIIPDTNLLVYAYNDENPNTPGRANGGKTQSPETKV